MEHINCSSICPMQSTSLHDSSESRAAPSKRFLLSHKSRDEMVTLESLCTYDGFLSMVAGLFPELRGTFRLIDADFQVLNNEKFASLMSSRSPEVWLLVSADDSDVTLTSPKLELMKYDVHPNALTESGSMQLSSCYQAFCEFIDNSIQATKGNVAAGKERAVAIHVFLKHKCICFRDNGEGMSSEGMKAFASYFLSQSCRGLERDSERTFGYMDGFISKFGVGATQAGFYLADTIKVISKRAGCPFVTEITISKDKLHQRAKLDLPVFEDYKHIRASGDKSTLDEVEAKCLGSFVSSETTEDHFTMVVLRNVYDKHIAYLKEDGAADLAQNLAHVYHFYVHGIYGSKGVLNFEGLSLKGITDFSESSQGTVDISIHLEDSRGATTVKSLKDVKDDLQSIYQEKAKSVFSFQLELKLKDVSQPQIVQGCLMYFPNEGGQETLPSEDEGSTFLTPLFECFWQGRLAPMSFVNRLKFFSLPVKRSTKQKDLLPDVCFQRIRGVLFFNRHTPVSNNKLKILLDSRKDLSDALSDASAYRRLPDDFRTWLEFCHTQFDSEIVFDELLPASMQPGNGDLFYASLLVIANKREEVYTTGDVVRIDTRPVAYGMAKYFIKKAGRKEVGSVVYVKLPEEVYGDCMEERSVMRLGGKPEASQLSKILEAEMMLLPKSMIVTVADEKEPCSDKMTFQAGKAMRDQLNFWVAVLNGENPPKLMTSLYHRKISVTVEIPDKESTVNETPKNDRFGFRPFWFEKVGQYVVTFVVRLGDSEKLKSKIDIHVTPNVSETVKLLDDSPNAVKLGDPCISFLLQFFDGHGNPTTLFKGNKKKVKLACTCEDIVICGIKDSYVPGKDGKLKVSNISLEPAAGAQLNTEKEYIFRIDAVGIGDVAFPIKILTGPPEQVRISDMATHEFDNYGTFPDLEVTILDRWSQPSMLSSKHFHLALASPAFCQGTVYTAISNGRAKFPPTSIKIAGLKTSVKMDVKVNLVVLNGGNKMTTEAKKIVKELSSFSITVHPSLLCHKIKIAVPEGRIQEGDVLELDAAAGSTFAGLKVVGFTESGRCLTVQEFLEQQPQLTTTWAEVNMSNFPVLPDCPVTNIVQTNVQSVRCFCKQSGFEVKSEAKIRINVLPGEPVRYSWIKTSEQAVRCGAKKDLSSTLKVAMLDRHHNHAVPADALRPYVTVSSESSSVQLSGELVLKNGVFEFTSPSVLTGSVGMVTVTVQDDQNLCVGDSVTVNLACGEPSMVKLSCTGFEFGQSVEEPRLRMLSRSSIAFPLLCCVTDSFGNPVAAKTSIRLDWEPASAGAVLTKMTNRNGEVTFPAGTVKCVAQNGTVKFGISAPDLRTVQTSWVTCPVQACNRVKTLCVTSDESYLKASSAYPMLKVAYETEDGVPYDISNSISVGAVPPSGRRILLDSVYTRRKFDGGMVELNSDCVDRLEMAGEWKLSCTYTEMRSDLAVGEDGLVQSEPVTLSVTPGPATKILVDVPAGCVLSASNAADPLKRTIMGLQSAKVRVVDSYNNLTTRDVVVALSIEGLGDLEASNQILPELERRSQSVRVYGGMCELPKIMLKEDAGNASGYYNLVFSSEDLQPFKVRLAFSTSAEQERVMKLLTPLKNELAKCKSAFDEKRHAYAKRKSDFSIALLPVRKYFSTPLPTVQAIEEKIRGIRERLGEVESGLNVRPCTKEANAPPQNVRQYIKGLVCELAYVTDVNLCRILSWYQQQKLRVALTESAVQQRKVYDLGYPAYAETMLLPFRHNGRKVAPNEVLPLDLPKPPAGFRSSIDFAVNLLEFPEKNMYLRSTLFWSIFSKTIVVKDVEHAQKYREHLVRMEHSCPAILTLNGDLIASDGLMDPTKRCPPELSQLKYTFGALPPSERNEAKDLHGELHCLQELIKVRSETDFLAQQVEECKSNLASTQSTLSPKIRSLEAELSELEKRCQGLQMAAILGDPPSAKRRRK